VKEAFPHLSAAYSVRMKSNNSSWNCHLHKWPYTLRYEFPPFKQLKSRKYNCWNYNLFYKNTFNSPSSYNITFLQEKPQYSLHFCWGDFYRTPFF
jgi:hypothetical protein